MGGDPTSNVDANGNIDPKAKDMWQSPNASATAGTLKFNVQSALDCARMCQTAIEWVYAAQSQAQTMFSTPLASTPYSQWPSGTALPSMFDNAVNNLNSAFSNHITVLQEMADTFIKAGKTYEAADGDSATTISSNWDGITIPTSASSAANSVNWSPAGTDLPTNLSDMTKEYGYRGKNANHEDPDKSVISGSGVPTSIATTLPQGMDLSKPNAYRGLTMNGGPELNLNSDPNGVVDPIGGIDDRIGDDPPPENLQYDDLYELGNTYLLPAIGATNQASLDWANIAGQLGPKISQLTTFLTSPGVKEGWTGTGATQAQNAALNYQAQADALTTRMTQMHYTLDYTSNWLGYTLWNMPAVPSSSLTGTKAEGTVQNQIDAATKKGRDAISTFYVDGVCGSSTSVPVIQGPQVPPPVATGPGPGPATPGPATPGPASIPGPALSAATSSPGPTGLGSTSASDTTAAQQAASLQAQEQQAAAQQAQATAQEQSSQQDQSAQSALQQLAQTGQQAAQQAAQQSAQQGLSAAQQAAMAGMQTASSALNGLGGMDGAALSKLSRAGGLGSLASEEALAAESQASKLFPRAALSSAALESELAGTARAGAAAAGPAMGPGMAGGRGSGSDKEKEHKRPAYLESDEPLEEAFGTAPLVARPVVDE